MGVMRTVFRGMGLNNELHRFNRIWFVSIVAAIFLAAACSTGSGSENPQMFNEDGDPIGEATPGSRPVNLDPAPDFQISTFQNVNYERGDVWRLSDFRGQPVVLNFWFPSCPPCIAEMPDLEEAFGEFNPLGVEFVGVQLVSLDTIEDGQEFVDLLEVTYALGADETDGSEIIFDKYGVGGFPSTIFINAEHDIECSWTGILTKKKLDELIGELLDSSVKCG